MIYENEHDEQANLECDYFLRLVNSSINICSRIQEGYVKQALAKRRAAYQQENWLEYAAVVRQMSENQQTKHEEVLIKICEALGISE